MLLIISPAKKLKAGSLYSDKKTEIRFPKETQILAEHLKKMKPNDLSKLMNISPKLGELNYERYIKWNFPFNSVNSGSAIFLFQGDVYQGMNAESFSDEDIEFAQQHLRILSGLYGVLRPLDQILPYRLEMGTKLKNKKGKNLYEFWGNKINKMILNDLEEQGDNVLINLASNEYYKSVKTKKTDAQIIKPSFKEYKDGKYKMISFYAKKARGMMCRYIIQNKLTKAQDIKGFDFEKYSFNHELSNEHEFVFTR